MFVSEIFH